jgi:hypothetical protein
MYTVEIFEGFGPFCGRGGYASVKTSVSVRRSVKAALRIAIEAHKQNVYNADSLGGGVPVYISTSIFRNGNLVDIII